MYKDKGWLEEQYWGNGLSTIQMASLAGVGRQTISNWMKRHNISRRTASEILRGKKQSPDTIEKRVAQFRGEKNPNWKGGRRLRSDGYIRILRTTLSIHEQNKFASMFDVRGRVLEHRIIMARHIGRALHRWEIVHHKNGIKDDNRLENLELLPKQAGHLTIQNLQKENLKWQRAFYYAVAMWLREREYVNQARIA